MDRTRQTTPEQGRWGAIGHDRMMSPHLSKARIHCRFVHSAACKNVPLGKLGQIVGYIVGQMPNKSPYGPQ
jgi:hypothetical protein